MNILLTIHKQNLAISIRIQGKRTYLHLPVIIREEFWTPGNVIPKSAHPNYKSILAYITDAELIIERETLYITKYNLSLKQAKEHLRQCFFGTRDPSLKEYAKTFIEKLIKEKRIKYATNIETGINSFLEFMGGDCELKDITVDDIKRYINYLQDQDRCGMKCITYFHTGFNREVTMHLKKKPLKNNAVRNYLRSIRLVYRSAMGNEINPKNYPFPRGVMPKKNKTVKRNISQSYTMELEQFEAPEERLIRARDYYIAQFYMQGMDFCDLVALKDTNLVDGYVRFSRQKTQQEVTVKIFPKLAPLLEKYKVQSGYLFPTFEKSITTRKDLAEYEAARESYDRALFRIGKLLNIPIKLESKVPRHSWITIAKHLGVDEEIRMQAVGHRDENKVHNNYADDFPQYMIDEANAMVVMQGKATLQS